MTEPSPTVHYRRGFGSFHYSNVQELLELSEDAYVPPEIPIELPQPPRDCIFGKPARKEHFYLEEDFVFLNHGAFGCALKEGLQAAQQWQLYVERQPLRFLDRQLFPHLVNVTRRMAQFIGCDRRNLLLVPNVTTANNCVIRSLDLKAGDTVYMLSTEYGSNKKMLRHVCSQTGATLHEEPMHFPTSKEQILSLVENSLPAQTRLAIFNHIPSPTPMLMPVEELVELCHKRNILVLVDGAHALGQFPLDVTSIGADFYAGNCHKWFSAPKGSAFLHVAKEHKEKIRPLVISHGFGSGFNSEFIWQGLKDYSPWLALTTVLDFWQAIGPDRIRTYIRILTRDAAALLCSRWNTETLVPEELFAPGMVCVGLPKKLYAACEASVDELPVEVENLLHFRYKIEVPIKAVDKILYVRISAHIHNVISDYERLASAILELADEGALTQIINTS